MLDKSGWINPGDALLAYDANGNGRIDGINEVFGNMKKDGFTELREIADSNGDRVINNKDALYSQLQVWTDANGDAQSDEGELRTLKEAGITEIDLTPVKVEYENNGNIISDLSHYVDSDNKHEAVADV
jgi:hypothetical protein